MNIKIASPTDIEEVREMNKSHCSAYYDARDGGTCYLGPDFMPDFDEFGLVYDVVPAIVHETIHHLLRIHEGVKVTRGLDRLLDYIQWRFSPEWWHAIHDGQRKER